MLNSTYDIRAERAELLSEAILCGGLGVSKHLLWRSTAIASDPSQSPRPQSRDPHHRCPFRTINLKTTTAPAHSTLNGSKPSSRTPPTTLDKMHAERTSVLVEHREQKAGRQKVVDIRKKHHRWVRQRLVTWIAHVAVLSASRGRNWIT